MGIRNLLAAHDARFIRLLDLLPLFAKAEGVTIQEVARALDVRNLLMRVHLMTQMQAGDNDDMFQPGETFHIQTGSGIGHRVLKSIGRTGQLSEKDRLDLQEEDVGFIRNDVAAALSSCGFAIPDGLILDAPAKPTEASRQNTPSEELAAEVQRLRAELAASAALPAGAIHGKTFTKLAALIEAFPAAYPDPKRTKLDNDIRPWIKRTAGASDREAHVFGAILAEHFGLKE